MAEAARDQNHVTATLGVSSADSTLTLPLKVDPLTGRLLTDSAAGTGNVVGPASATDNAIVRFDGTTGKLIQDSAITVADTTGNMAGVGTINTLTLPSSSFVGLTDAQTLTNKVISGANNTLTVRLASDVSGNLPVTNLNSGTSASGTTFWRGDGTWATPSGSGTVNSGTAGQLAYYASSTAAVSGNANLTISTAALTIGVAGSAAGTLLISGATSGTTTLAVSATASGILTLPSATDTLVGKATTDTLTNKTYDTAGTGNVFKINGTQISAVNGSGAAVLTTSAALITPGLGVASATSINKVAITAPATSATLTIADGKTFTANNTLTLAGTDGKTLTISKTLTLDGTDSTTITFPSTSATVARTDAAQTFTGTQTFAQVITTANAIAASSNAATVPVTSRHNIVTNSSAGTLTITLTTTSAVNMQTLIVQVLDATAVAQTITWVNTENSTVSVPTTSNGSTSLPLTVGFIYNSATSKWRCIASA